MGQGAPRAASSAVALCRMVWHWWPSLALPAQLRPPQPACLLAFICLPKRPQTCLHALSMANRCFCPPTHLRPPDLPHTFRYSHLKIELADIDVADIAPHLRPAYDVSERAGPGLPCAGVHLPLPNCPLTASCSGGLRLLLLHCRHQPLLT